MIPADWHRHHKIIKLKTNHVKALDGALNWMPLAGGHVTGCNATKANKHESVSNQSIVVGQNKTWRQKPGNQQTVTWKMQMNHRNDMQMRRLHSTRIQFGANNFNFEKKKSSECQCFDNWPFAHANQFKVRVKVEWINLLEVERSSRLLRLEDRTTGDFVNLKRRSWVEFELDFKFETESIGILWNLNRNLHKDGHWSADEGAHHPLSRKSKNIPAGIWNELWNTRRWWWREGRKGQSSVVVCLLDEDHVTTWNMQHQQTDQGLWRSFHLFEKLLKEENSLDDNDSHLRRRVCVS